jgi:subfamily B ATP-binding cassette protein MsbA
MLNLIRYFAKIKQFIGNKIYVLLFLMITIGFMEGVGITLFLPILQAGFGDDKLSRILKFVFSLFRIDFSFKLFLLLIPAFFILRSISLIFYGRYSARLMANLMVALRHKVFEGVFRADYLYILKKEIGYINNAIVREIAGVVDAFNAFAKVLKYTILALVYITLFLILNFGISIMILALCPLIAFFMMRLNRLTNQASLDCSFTYGKFHSILIQCLSKFKYLKATLSNRKLSKIIDKENKNLGGIRFKLFFLQSLAKDAFEPVVVLFVAGLLFYHVVISGRHVNEIIFLAFLFLQAAKQFLALQASYRKFLASMGSIETFNRFEEELNANREDLNLKGLEPDFNSDIILKDVTIIFPNGKRGLDGVNITIKPKSVVAFVGDSGSGKSTVANMITGILKPTEGNIFIGDTDYDSLNLKALREKIGYVTQEDVIFNASIKENISLWDEDADENRLAKVMEMAYITGFVNDLPERQDSMLGDNGLDISGGQRQRITIARELYKDAKLLIMDEATSSLDSKAENKIYENLKEFKGRKTMVVIAHRLSTIKNADYVYVLDEGRIAEEGTYEQLHQNRGEFTKMVEAQKLL